MLSLLQLTETLNDLRMICEHVGLHHYRGNDDVVRQFGIVCVADLQRSPISIRLGGPQLTFGHSEICDRLATFKVFPREEVYLACRFKAEQVQRVEDQFQQALRLLDNLPGSVGALFRTVIREVAAFQVSGLQAGSHSSMIGLAYIIPSVDWSVLSFARVLFQQMIHSVIFLRDMSRSLMPEVDLLDRVENHCIGAQHRAGCSFDMAFHAACVVAATLWFDQQLAQKELCQTGSISDDQLETARCSVRQMISLAEQSFAGGRQVVSAEGLILLTELASVFDCNTFQRLEQVEISRAPALSA